MRVALLRRQVINHGQWERCSDPSPFRSPSLAVQSLRADGATNCSSDAGRAEDDAQREATGELAARPQRARSQSRKLTAGKRSKVRGPLSFYPDLWFRFLGAKSILQPAAYIGSSRAKPELKADRIGRPQSEIGDELAARVSPPVSPPLPPTTSAAPSVSSLLYPSLSPNRMSPSLHRITCHGRGIMCLLYVSLPSPLDRIAMGNNIAKWPKLQSPLRAQWYFEKCGRSA